MTLRLKSLSRLGRAAPYLMLLVVQVPIIAEAPLYSILGSPGGIRSSGHPWLAVLCGAMIFALQLRHSLALARGERPRGGAWTLLALAVLAYAPLHWLGLNWITMQEVLIASVPMVLGGWLAAAAIAGPLAYIGYQLAAVFPDHAGPPASADYIYWVTYYVATFTIVPAALYAPARLARVAGELRRTRTALAEAAVGRERLRVSRDLHDLLGHNLSAISLKGDLAIRLLRSDSQAAVDEINDLAEVARQALAGLQAITAGGPRLTLAGELASARTLLAAAGVTVALRGDASTVPPAVGEILAWAVREGTTNILRHAAAATVVITIQLGGGLVELEMSNDGARPPAGTRGSGLSGLTARVTEMSGSLSHQRLSDGWFQLTAQVPVTAPEESRWTASGCSSPKTST